MKVILRKIKSRAIPDDNLRSDPRQLLVWWYGPLTTNSQAKSIPKIVVFFRPVREDGSLDDLFLKREVALAHLGLLRIGTVWQNGVRVARVARGKKRFRVWFEENAWRFVSPYDSVHKHLGPNPIPSSDYRLAYVSDKNYLLEFKLPEGRHLFIPCVEFFFRCYGRSAEVKRVLATYPWTEAEPRLYKPFDEGASRPGMWPIKLARRIHDADAVFLAHVKYDPYACRAAKCIYAQAEAPLSNTTRYVFLKAGPWFQGPAEIEVEGIHLERGGSFLGLRIVGCSDPRGKPVLRDRENPYLFDSDATSRPCASEHLRASLRRPPDVVELTEDEEPDDGLASLEIEEEDDYKVLGQPRAVIPVRRARPSGGNEALIIVSESASPRICSTGEPHGRGKGVGAASTCADTLLESHGLLHDVWNAARHLQRKHPHTIQAVHWYTFKDGFQDADHPRLIALKPFHADGDGPAEGSNAWVYIDPHTRTPRGALVIRLQLAERPVYLFELQRRFVWKPSAAAPADFQKTFRGLVFTLDDQAKFVPWLRALLSEVRRVKGVLKHLRWCPGSAHVFKHVSAAKEDLPCEAAVKNALKKVGIDLRRAD